MTDSSIKQLAAAMAAIDDKKEAEAFLRDLTTPSELRALAERWHVANLLAEGALTYRQIHDATGVSTTTITRVARFLNSPENKGYRAMIEKLSPQKA